jgi:hypothetical protein
VKVKLEGKRSRRRPRTRHPSRRSRTYIRSILARGASFEGPGSAWRLSKRSKAQGDRCQSSTVLWAAPSSPFASPWRVARTKLPRGDLATRAHVRLREKIADARLRRRRPRARPTACRILSWTDPFGLFGVDGSEIGRASDERRRWTGEPLPGGLASARGALISISRLPSGRGGWPRRWRRSAPRQ